MLTQLETGDEDKDRCLSAAARRWSTKASASRASLALCRAFGDAQFRASLALCRAFGDAQFHSELRTGERSLFFDSGIVSKFDAWKR